MAPRRQVNIRRYFGTCQSLGGVLVQTREGGLTYYGILGGSYIDSWLAFRSVPPGNNSNKREVKYRKSFQTMVHLGGRYKVRTFFLNIDEDIEIPTYLIPDSLAMKGAYP